ncbi:flagellar transcriptional regulator FlhD [Limnobacter alexandrii]|jgi:flagellar transcriptional activator FlhD|uniref:flagellar transcriptional regulator FlhD n=2 Tax=Limnobacter TaxID=131079 RepID=UPI00319E142D
MNGSWMIQVTGLQAEDTYEGIVAAIKKAAQIEDAVQQRLNWRMFKMKSTRLLDEIRETNLSYLLLAQQLIREDRAEATFRLGISEEVAELIDQLTTAQVLRIASSNMLMCRFRFDDEVVWNLLTSHTKDRSVSGMHAAIIMSGKAVNAAA